MGAHPLVGRSRVLGQRWDYGTVRFVVCRNCPVVCRSGWRWWAGASTCKEAGAVIRVKDASDMRADGGGGDGKGARVRHVSLKPKFCARGLQIRRGQIPSSHQIIKHVLPFCFLNLLSKRSNELLILISPQERALLPLPGSVWNIVVDILFLLGE